MSHLTAEEIEQTLTDGASQPEHLLHCTQCRQKVEQAQALRGRLRSAFGSIRADDGLKQSVLGAIRGTVFSPNTVAENMAAAPAAAKPATANHRKQPLRPRIYSFARTTAPRVAALAALVAIAILIGFQLSSPQAAVAASAELAGIHQANLSSHRTLHEAADPATVAAFFKKELGFTPAFPELGAGMDLRGCCTAYFRNRPVGSYVLNSDRGVISVIVVREKVQSLALGSTAGSAEGRSYHVGSFASNAIVAAEAGGFTYCVVGETDVAWMMEVMDCLLTNKSAG